jgi:hypothetical protein
MSAILDFDSTVIKHYKCSFKKPNSDTFRLLTFFGRGANFQDEIRRHVHPDKTNRVRKNGRCYRPSAQWQALPPLALFGGLEKSPLLNVIKHEKDFSMVKNYRFSYNSSGAIYPPS